VDFCEDAIFEMQHAESLMKSGTDEGGSGGGGKRKRKLMMPDDEDEPKGVVEPLKKNVRKGKEAAVHYLSYLSPASIKAGMAKAKTMSAVDLAVLLISSVFWVGYGCG